MEYQASSGPGLSDSDYRLDAIAGPRDGARSVCDSDRSVWLGPASVAQPVQPGRAGRPGPEMRRACTSCTLKMGTACRAWGHGMGEGLTRSESGDDADVRHALCE